MPKLRYAPHIAVLLGGHTETKERSKMKLREAIQVLRKYAIGHLVILRYSGQKLDERHQNLQKAVNVVQEFLERDATAQPEEDKK